MGGRRGGRVDQGWGVEEGVREVGRARRARRGGQEDRRCTSEEDEGWRAKVGLDEAEEHLDGFDAAFDAHDLARLSVAPVI